MSKHLLDFPWYSLAALNLAVYIISAGFVIELPMLPVIIKVTLPARTSLSLISLHTAMVTSLYAFCIFVFAGFWTKLARRHTPSSIILIGLSGFAVTMLIFSQTESLAALYLGRFFSGFFAAGVMPIAAGMVASYSLDEKNRHRRLGFMSVITIAGFFLGPLMGLVIIRLTAELYPATLPSDALSIRMMAIAALAILAAIAVVFTVPNLARHSSSMPGEVEISSSMQIESKLVTLIFIVAMAIGILEIGISLLGNMHLTHYASSIALLFAECALVMLITQAIVFAPWFKLNNTRWIIPLALFVLTVSLLSTPWVTDPKFIFWGISSSAGILSPLLSHWYSACASLEHREQGRQSALFSLGLAVGAVAGSTSLMDSALFKGTFLLVGISAIIGVFISLKLARKPLLSR